MKYNSVNKMENKSLKSRTRYCQYKYSVWWKFGLNEIRWSRKLLVGCFIILKHSNVWHWTGPNLSINLAIKCISYGAGRRYNLTTIISYYPNSVIGPTDPLGFVPSKLRTGSDIKRVWVLHTRDVSLCDDGSG